MPADAVISVLESTSGSAAKIDAATRAQKGGTSVKREKVEASVYDFENEIGASVSSLRELLTTQRTRLGGDIFGNGIDANYFDTPVTGSGSLTDASATGFLNLRSGATAGSTARIRSKKRFGFLTGTEMSWQSGVLVPTGLPAGAWARLGMYDDNDGWFFYQDATGLSVATRKGTVDTLVAAGQWSERPSASVPTVFSRFKINYHTLGYFEVGGRMIHMTPAAVLPYTVGYDFPWTAEVGNGGNAFDVQLRLTGFVVNRLGAVLPSIRSWRMNTAGTTVVKNAPGILDRIIIGKAANGSSVALYDSASSSPAAADQFALIDTTSLRDAIDFGAYELSKGLVATVTGTPDVTLFFA